MKMLLYKSLGALEPRPVPGHRGVLSLRTLNLNGSWGQVVPPAQFAGHEDPGSRVDSDSSSPVCLGHQKLRQIGPFLCARTRNLVLVRAPSL